MVDRALVDEAFSLGFKEICYVVCRLGANSTEVSVIETGSTLMRTLTDTHLAGRGVGIQCSNSIRINPVVSSQVHF
jgi:hypothetical protein